MKQWKEASCAVIVVVGFAVFVMQMKSNPAPVRATINEPPPVDRKPTPAPTPSPDVSGPQVFDPYGMAMPYPVDDSGAVDPSCQYVYLDMGSNRGVQIRKLFQPDLYPLASVHDIFDNHFPRSHRSSVCAIGWEIIPLHDELLQFIEEQFTAVGLRTWFHKSTGVGVHDGDGLALLDGAAGNGYWTANIVPAGTDVPDGSSSFPVKIMGVSSFLKKMGKRKAVVAKIDIEGLEYDVLDDIIGDKSICLIDEIYIETHASPKAKPFEELQAMAKAACPPGKGVLTWLDDESYYVSNIGLCPSGFQTHQT